VWRDPNRPADERVKDLLDQMTLEEKVAQLYGVWLGTEGAGGQVAPNQQDMAPTAEFDWEGLITVGLGQFTRPFGTAPIAPVDGARRLAKLQAQVADANRFGLPALAHEECLTGWTTWQATIYPTPLAWGASFDPELVKEMAAQIGASMAGLGIHQGLSPVLDVARDPRWGRTEETIGEDPYLVATVATAYVQGLQSAGVHATLKHFVGYSASRGGRNFGPVSVGPRELAELLLPFEMAVRHGGARSVMAAYTTQDGMPAHADRWLLTDLLRDAWGFDGVVVSDYFGVGFLHSQHSLVEGPGEAAGLALDAGMDVELPMLYCFGDPLVRAVRDGKVAEKLVDRAAYRVLRQKCDLGLLDPDWAPEPPALDGQDRERSVDLDPPRSRATARRLAEESVVLLANDDALPLSPTATIAVVGPLADDRAAMLGCYTFPQHVGRHHPELDAGPEIPTLLESLSREFPEATLVHSVGCPVAEPDTGAIPDAVRAAEQADVCVVVVGDSAGLFGMGTSGEGCDAADLNLPGSQGELVRALLATSTPVVLLVMSGRPYALGEYSAGAAAVVQAFFPGEEGGPAAAGVLSGRINPSGRLPIAIPHGPGGQPAPYLTSAMGQKTGVSSVDPTPVYPFGYGLSYTGFAWEDVRVDGAPAAEDTEVEFREDTSVRLSLSVRNTGGRDGTEVVQLYVHDPFGQVARPVMRLIGYARVPVEAGQARRVEFEVHPDTFALATGADRRVVEPGAVELRFSSSSAEVRHTVRGRTVGPERAVGPDRHMLNPATVD
jgi:beta-xylosidase